MKSEVIPCIAGDVDLENVANLLNVFLPKFSKPYVSYTYSSEYEEDGFVISEGPISTFDAMGIFVQHLKETYGEEEEE